MAIVGTARLREVQTLAPNAAWREHHPHLGLTRQEFDAYLDGSLHAWLLLLNRVCMLNEPLSLHHLRRDGQFHPPQSFRYIAASDPAPVRHLIPTPVPAMGDQRENAPPETVRKPDDAPWHGEPTHRRVRRIHHRPDQHHLGAPSPKPRSSARAGRRCRTRSGSAGYAGASRGQLGSLRVRAAGRLLRQVPRQVRYGPIGH